jgi:hypothetical protein
MGDNGLPDQILTAWRINNEISLWLKWYFGDPA